MDFEFDESVTPFNLEHALQCGQVLRWEKKGDWWYGVVDENVIKIKESGGKLSFFTFPEELDMGFITNYFRLDDDLPHILSQIKKDPNMAKVIQKFSGLRIIRQNPWECLISYICATFKNIPAIENTILCLSKRFGRKIHFDGYEFYTFPEPSTLAKTSLSELRNCGLGYRAEYLLRTSQLINKGRFDLESLRKLNYENAKKKLRTLPGVGPKVADCVLLFSLDKLDAFAVDVWLKRAILEFYPQYFDPSFVEKVYNKKSITDREYDEINSFARKYFGKYSGYAQQYLFYYKRTTH